MTDTALARTPGTALRFGAPSLIVRGLDLHTRLFLKMIKGAIRKWNSDLPTIDKVRPPWSWEKAKLLTVPFGDVTRPIQLPTTDEDWPASDWKRRFLLAVLRSEYLFPVVDRKDAWANPEVARDTFQEALPLGSYMARPYHYWKEMRSDAAMSRLAFAGLGALRLMPYERDEADPPTLIRPRWQHDLRLLARYAVRDGFESYGARAIFDEDQRPIAIYWCEGNAWVYPGDPGWAHAKWAWRCSLMVGTTVVDHLVGVHWLIGNYVTSAARFHLPPTHYLRMLLKPFTWRTVTINAGACETLCPERGFVHRASALTYEALLQAFGDATTLLDFHTVPDMVARKGAAGMGDRFPWMTDALALYEVIHAFVVDYLGEYAEEIEAEGDAGLVAFWDYLNAAPTGVRFPDRSREALVDVLSQFIWSVTGLHEAVGTVHEYVTDPTFMGTKIRRGVEMADIQASMQYLLVMALTGLNMPRLLDLGDAEGVFDADHRGRRAFQRFHDRLVVLAAENDAANARRLRDPERPWPCETFNPKNLETGVSI
jgi:hypothetical protein